MTRTIIEKPGAGSAVVLALALWTVAVGAQAQTSTPADDGELRSEFLFDLVLATDAPHKVGADRTIVPVTGGTFEGPVLRGTIIGPGADWIATRADGSRLLDVRLLLKIDDGAEVYMTWRGIGYTPPGGPLYARILPMFETGASKYSWLNTIVAVGVHRAMPGRVAYRIYRIL